MNNSCTWSEWHVSSSAQDSIIRYTDFISSSIVSQFHLDFSDCSDYWAFLETDGDGEEKTDLCDDGELAFPGWKSCKDKKSTQKLDTDLDDATVKGDCHAVSHLLNAEGKENS